MRRALVPLALVLLVAAGCSSEPDTITVELPTRGEGMTLEAVWESQTDRQKERTCADFRDPDSSAHDVWYDTAADHGLTNMTEDEFDAWVDEVCAGL